jgi:plasmid stabilization system protein ParE
MTGYAFHPDAFADLDEIWEYIAQDNVDAADRVLADIHSTLTLLAGSPQIGHRRPDLTTRPLRFHVARDESLIPLALAELGSIDEYEFVVTVVARRASNVSHRTIDERNGSARRRRARDPGGGKP